MADAYRDWLHGKIGETCVKNLIAHGFDAHWVADAEQAKQLILERIDSYHVFGFGGSNTTRSLGLHSELASRGKKILDHLAEGFDLEQSLAVRREQMQCDCFLCSANAISMKGEIVNVDGVGNRTNAMSFGPRHVVIMAGINKVAPDLESALKRVRQVAAPMRAKSLGMATPCAETGLCSDCNAPQRICNITTILHRKPMMTQVTVVLINEDLGY